MPESSEYNQKRHELDSARACRDWSKVKDLTIDCICARPHNDCLPVLESYLREAEGELAMQTSFAGRLATSLGIRRRVSEVPF